jgi:hypothetical protein
MTPHTLMIQSNNFISNPTQFSSYVGGKKRKTKGKNKKTVKKTRTKKTVKKTRTKKTVKKNKSKKRKTSKKCTGLFCWFK